MFAELLATPGVEERAVLRSRVGFLALHGGLEAATAEIAHAAAEAAGASLYAVVQPDDVAWHIPSHHVEPAASPDLLALLDHCDVVVSVHGYGRAGFWKSVLVGGGSRTLATALAQRLRAVLPEYSIVDDLMAIPEGLRGLDPRNPVNRTRRGGVQIELPPRVRGIGPHWAGFEGAGFTPHTAALVGGLTEFARTYSDA